MKTRHLLMLAGLSIAAWLVFFGDNSPDTESAKPLPRSPAVPASATSAAPAAEIAILSPAPNRAASQVLQKEADPQILALQPRAGLIAGGSVGHGGNGLFSSKSWALPSAKAKVEPPPPPTAPTLPFTYLGKQAAGGHLEVYLAQGDRVIVVRENSVIEGTYRVESIKSPTLSLTYLPLNQIQQLSIGVTD